MSYKLKKHVTSEMLESVGFESYEGRYFLTRDIGLFCDVQGENETIWVNLDEDNRRNIYGREILFNGGYLLLDIKDYIQDLIEKGWVEEV